MELMGESFQDAALRTLSQGVSVVRADARTCSTRCRVALYRFARRQAAAVTGCQRLSLSLDVRPRFERSPCNALLPETCNQ